MNVSTRNTPPAANNAQFGVISLIYFLVKLDLSCYHQFHLDLTRVSCGFRVLHQVMQRQSVVLAGRIYVVESTNILMTSFKNYCHFKSFVTREFYLQQKSIRFSTDDCYPTTNPMKSFFVVLASKHHSFTSI